MADPIPTSEAAQVLGLASPDAARRQLSRWGVRPLYRQAGKGGQSMWDPDVIAQAKANRLGRGARTDLTEEPQP